LKKRIQSHIKYIDEILTGNTGIEINEILLKRHLREIDFFMHERLIHLIVTVVFALLTLISLSVFIVAQNMGILLLTGLFFILLVPYIFHYYILENGVQKMYEQYDKMFKIIYKIP
jgi:hypothetical protein